MLKGKKRNVELLLRARRGGERARRDGAGPRDGDARASTWGSGGDTRMRRAPRRSLKRWRCCSQGRAVAWKAALAAFP